MAGISTSGDTSQAGRSEGARPGLGGSLSARNAYIARAMDELNSTDPEPSVERDMSDEDKFKRAQRIERMVRLLWTSDAHTRLDPRQVESFLHEAHKRIDAAAARISAATKCAKVVEETTRAAEAQALVRITAADEKTRRAEEKTRHAEDCLIRMEQVMTTEFAHLRPNSGTKIERGGVYSIVVSRSAQ